MDGQLGAICLLTLIINLIATLAYAARIAGVRTGRIAMSFALFNALVLFSRLSNGFLGPLIANRVEVALAQGHGGGLLFDFRLVILAATVGVLIGIAFIPTAQRLFVTVIARMQARQSLANIALRSVTPGGLRALREAAVVPQMTQLSTYGRPKEVNWGILVANALAQAILVVGVLASIYAGYLVPEYRVTASQLSALINGFATILLFLIIDPQLSVLTDDVVDGELSHASFRKAIFWISGSRVVGTLFAQFLFLPAAIAIAWSANAI